MLLDTRQSLETPEGALLPLTPAGFGVRTLAQLLDILIRYGIVTVLFILLSLLGKMGTGIALILAFLLEWFYPVYFEVSRQGRTPGKKWMGIRVVNDDGTPITFGPSLLRNLLRFIDFLPMLYLTGIIACLCNRQFKRLGDLAAGGVAVDEDFLGIEAEVVAIFGEVAEGVLAVGDAVADGDGAAFIAEAVVDRGDGEAR